MGSAGKITVTAEAEANNRQLQFRGSPSIRPFFNLGRSFVRLWIKGISCCFFGTTSLVSLRGKRFNHEVDLSCLQEGIGICDLLPLKTHYRLRGIRVVGFEC